MKTNDLRHSVTKSNVTIDGQKCDIIAKIRLNDECKNGHQDFSITGEMYKAGKRGDHAMISCGCIHEDILKAFPEFKIFVDLHLCDYSGAPMYAVENGFYHLRKGFNNTPAHDEKFKAEFCKYYRINSVQFDKINESENKLEYALLLKDLGILEQWQKQANEGIKLLESLTGNEFLNDSVKTQYNAPKIEEINDFKVNHEAGYYSLENKQKRAIEKRESDKKAVINAIKAACKKETDKATEEQNIKLWLISHIEKLNKKGRGFSLDFSFENYIYYNHTKKLKFNWLDYKTKMSLKEFKMFCDAISESDLQTKLSKGLSFKFDNENIFANK